MKKFANKMDQVLAKLAHFFTVKAIIVSALADNKKAQLI